MKICKHCIIDEISDKYCGNDRCPYTSDWCELHDNKDIECEYKEVDDDKRIFD